MKLGYRLALLATLGLVGCAVPTGAAVESQSVKLQQYFAVSVTDVDAAVAWYQKAFDLELLTDTTAPDARWRIANLSSECLFVELIRDNRAVAVDRAKGIAKVGFEIADLQAALRMFEAKLGGTYEVHDFAPAKQRLAQLRDPEGNIIQIYERYGSKP